MGRTNDAVEAVLLEYADLLAIVAEDRFKPRAYEKAARAVGGYHADLDGMDLAEIRQIPSVGTSIARQDPRVPDERHDRGARVAAAARSPPASAR